MTPNQQEHAHQNKDTSKQEKEMQFRMKLKAINMAETETILGNQEICEQGGGSGLSIPIPFFFCPK